MHYNLYIFRRCHRRRIRRPEPRLVSIVSFFKNITPRESFLHWIFIFRLVVSLNGAQGTIYEGEQFQLQFRFGPKYPFDSPEVTCHFPFNERIDNTDTYFDHSLFRLCLLDPKSQSILTSIATVGLHFRSLSNSFSWLHLISVQQATSASVF